MAAYSTSLVQQMAFGRFAYSGFDSYSYICCYMGSWLVFLFKYTFKTNYSGLIDFCIGGKTNIQFKLAECTSILVYFLPLILKKLAFYRYYFFKLLLSPTIRQIFYYSFYFIPKIFLVCSSLITNLRKNLFLVVYYFSIFSRFFLASLVRQLTLAVVSNAVQWLSLLSDLNSEAILSRPTSLYVFKLYINLFIKGFVFNLILPFSLFLLRQLSMFIIFYPLGLYTIKQFYSSLYKVGDGSKKINQQSVLISFE